MQPEENYLMRMSNYQGMKGMELIVVFDAYRVKGHETEITDYMNIHVVYTKEAETADQYIEKFAPYPWTKIRCNSCNIRWIGTDHYPRTRLPSAFCKRIKRETMKKQKHRSEQNIWRIRKMENLYDGWNILGERTAREGKLIIQKWRR